MNAIKDLTLPSFSFLVGAILIVFAIVRNISIKEINVKLTFFQSFFLGILGLVFVGIGIYGYFLYPQISVTDLLSTPKPPTSSSNDVAENTESPIYSSITSDAFRNSLFDGQSLVSSNGQHMLKLKNGVVTLYSNGKVIWKTKTEGSNADQLVIQADGNLVLYAKSVYIWDTSTSVKSPAKAYTFEVQNDGNLVIYDNNGLRIWSLK
ncbi:MAG: hypothetical protein HY869_14065 [Chloroflexi bacterium]|nr:hypothetical protein [Chloroflexota bacterium]